MPLLGQVPLTMPLREQADAGVPLVAVDPDDPAAQAIRQAARGLIAMAPAAPIALPVLDSRPGRPAAAGRDVAPDGRLTSRLRRSPRRRASPLDLPAKYAALRSANAAHSSGSWSSAKHASTGHASTQASQSMHSSGSM